jgi:hypothetical protein
VLQPKRNIGDRGWHNFLVPLEKYSGRTVCMIFSTSGSGDDLSYSWSAWGWGKIVQFEKHPENSLLQDIPDIFTDRESIDLLKKCEGFVRYGNKKAVIENVELLNSNRSPQFLFKTGEEIFIRYTMIANEDFDENLTIGFIIRNKFTEVYGTNTRWRNCDLAGIKKGHMPVVTISIGLALGTGTYSLTSAIAIVHPGFVVEVLDRLEDHIIFYVKNDQNMSGFIDLKAIIKIE